MVEIATVAQLPRNDKVTVNSHILDSFQQIIIYLFFKIKKHNELINEDYTKITKQGL